MALTSQTFIKKAKKVHKDKYDYSKVFYTNKETHIQIVCPEHGEFSQRPVNHLKGNGCPICAKEKKKIPKKYTYDYCYNIAKQYKYMCDFYKENYNIYIKCEQNKWLTDFTWLNTTNLSLKYKEYKTNCVYAYEYENNFVYVGLTNNIKRRDYDHKTDINDTLFSYSNKNNLQIPNYKILENNLTSYESALSEIKWIKIYKDNGWHLINKNKGGTIGGNKFIVWSDDDIIKESKKYSSKIEMYKKSRTAYNHMIDRELTNIC